MNVASRICGIGREIVGAAAAARPGPPISLAPRSGASIATTSPIFQSLGARGTTRQQSIQNGVVTPTSPNPTNTPGQPGYTPALPAGAPVPGLPGYNPYQATNPASGYNAQNPYNAPGLPGYNPYMPSGGAGYQATPPPYYGGGYGGYGDYNAPTSADFGLPMGGGYDYSGGSGLSPDLSYAFNDPTDTNAINSYFDPTSQLGPWSF